MTRHPPEPAAAGGVEVLRVAERALLVRFLDDDLGLAVARSQALAHALRAPALEGGGKSQAGSEGGGRGERLSVEEGGDPRPSLADPTRVVDDRSSASADQLASAELVLGAGNLLVVLPGAAVAEVERWRARLHGAAVALSFSGSLFSFAGPNGTPPAVEHRFEVRYGGEEGPDLAAVAREAGMSPERVVELHAAARFTVAFVGFSPGFGYLTGLPRALEVARLAAPRPLVPAGSVAIAGAFAGVYPSATPGGWRLIGRLAPGAPVLFDPGSDPPARLAPGERVRFVPARG